MINYFTKTQCFLRAINPIDQPRSNNQLRDLTEAMYLLCCFCYTGAILFIGIDVLQQGRMVIANCFVMAVDI